MSIDIHVANVCNVNSECAYAIYAQVCWGYGFTWCCSVQFVPRYFLQGSKLLIFFMASPLTRRFHSCNMLQDGPLPLASTYVDGCWWHFNLNSVRCSNYNHVTKNEGPFLSWSIQSPNRVDAIEIAYTDPFFHPIFHKLIPSPNNPMVC